MPNNPMEKKNILLTSLLSLAAITTASAQDVQLTLHPDKAENIIPKEIYGQFAEHLGRCIYGGI